MNGGRLFKRVRVWLFVGRLLGEVCIPHPPTLLCCCG